MKEDPTVTMFRASHDERMAREERQSIVVRVYPGDLAGNSPEEVERYIKSELRMAMERLGLPERTLIVTEVKSGDLPGERNPK